MPHTLPRGLYRHYKGNLYELLHTARHSETEEPLAVYRALCGTVCAGEGVRLTAETPKAT